MTFQLPEQLPPSVAELDLLLDEALADINVIRARHAAKQPLEEADVAELRRLLDATKTIKDARDTAQTHEAQHAEAVEDAIRRADEAVTPPETDEVVEDPQPEPVVEAEVVEAEVAEPEPVSAAAAPVSFAGVGAGSDNLPELRQEPGWELDPSAPGFQLGQGGIGFVEIAASIDSVRPGSRTKQRPNKPAVDGWNSQVLARLHRDVKVAQDSRALVAAIKEATDQRRLPGGSLMKSLTAGGGWCAPSEQLYNFCDVPAASDLVSLPEITINRGGVRWPVEPDLSTLFEDFEWFYTEPELEAVDSGTGDPTAQKTCVQVPCPDEFVELRLNALGYCVEAGILESQGWPELISWFLQSLAQEHLRALSKRTVLDMVSGSTAKTIDPDTQIGAISSVLNSLEIQAYNLRADRGLGRSATIEGVAPNWLPSVLRADAAMRDDGSLALTDGEIISWLSARNIALQFVGDWQTRDTGKPGNINTLAWPSTVDVLLYPAGTWFRAMSPVIELGVQYPRELLQINRYTRVFFEDALAVGKRCNKSLKVTVPICVSGAIGDRQSVACSSGS